ncbi:hypothetical protein ACIHDR_46980 [Nocardia sp. NPDC052278]|uniref:hypothetical protein n=1 Tax=unclassified Nocardia TaxID=2637762 RepID=UPI0036A225EA
MNTATNRNSRWLFPGRRAGQPMHSETLGGLLKALGVLNVPGRTSAMRQHVQQMPAPVVADALGYHHVTTKLAAEAAVRSRYVTALGSAHLSVGLPPQLVTVEYAISPVRDPLQTGEIHQMINQNLDEATGTNNEHDVSGDTGP